MLPQEYREKMISKRFMFKDDAVLVSDDFIGVVRDISLGTITFQYMDRGQSLSGNDLEIMAPFSHFLLTKREYTFKKSSVKKNGAGTKLNTCCLLLSNLSELKKRKLWNFIQKNCIGSISKHRDNLSDMLKKRFPQSTLSGGPRVPDMHYQPIAANVVQL